MTLQMLSVKVCLGAVRAREFAICVLLGDLGLGRSSSRGWRSRPTRSAGQDSPAALGANHVSGLVILLENRWLCHHGTLRVGRSQATLGHDTASWHGSQDWRDATAGRGRGRDRLGVSLGDR